MASLLQKGHGSLSALQHGRVRVATDLSQRELRQADQIMGLSVLGIQLDHIFSILLNVLPIPRKTSVASDSILHIHPGLANVEIRGVLGYSLAETAQSEPHSLLSLQVRIYLAEPKQSNSLSGCVTIATGPTTGSLILRSSFDIKVV